MAGHQKFNQLIENISPEIKAKIAQKTAQIKQEIDLNQSSETLE